MKKLYLFATLAMVAFTSFAGIDTMVKKDVKTSLFEKTESIQVLSNKDLKVAKLNAEKKAEEQKEAQKKAASKQSQDANKRVMSLMHEQATNLKCPQRNASDFSAVKSSAKKGALYAPTVNQYGIITDPGEGTTKYYKRSGGGYFLYNQQLYTYDQSSLDLLETVEASDGTVYFKNLVGKYTSGAWVKGTKSGNEITVPTRQPVNYNSQYKTTLSVRWGTIAENSLVAADEIADAFTFVIAGDSIALQNTDPDGNFMGVFWDDDNTPSGYGDYNTVLKEFEFEPKSRDLVELPEGLTPETWVVTAVEDYDEETGKPTEVTSHQAKVAFKGVGVYVQGLFENFPDAWVKGVKLGNSIVFEQYQYLGKKGSDEAWAVGFEETADGVNFIDFAFTYDANANTLTANNIIGSNASETSLNPIDLYFATLLEKFVPIEYVAPFEDSMINYDSKTFLSYTVIDANGDGTTWRYDTIPYYSFNSKNDADDWIITPAIQLEADKLYAFEIEARNSGSYAEKFEVKLGKAPTVEALTTTLIDTTTVTDNNFTAFPSDEFTVSEAGKYYIGIHSVSDADMYKLVIRNISVKNGVSGIRPDSVTKASFVADAQGGLNAVLSFTAPALDSKKNALEGDVNVILALNGEAIDTVATTAGAEVIYPISVEEDGAYSVTLTPYVLETKLGAKTTVSTWIGLDAPAPVDTLIIANTGETLELTWPAVGNVGAHKGLVRPEEVTYNVYTVEIFEFLGMQIPMLGEILNEEPITGTSFSIPNDFENQGIVYYAVTAENDVDESEEVYATVLAGLPYELPLEESFDNGKMSYYWDIYYDDDSDWNGEAEGNGSFRLFFTGDNGGLTYFGSGMVNVKDADNPIVSVETKSFHGTPLSIFVRTASGAFNKYTTLETTAEFATQTVSLKDFTAEDWIQVYFVAQFPVQDTVYLDKIVLVDQLTYNLALSLDAPATVKAGGKADLVINVKNLGQNTVADYAVKVYADDALIDEFTKDETDELAFLESAEFVSKFEPTIFAQEGDVTLRAEVVFAADENTSDNAEESEITIKASEAAPVETVAAEAVDGGINVSWTVAEASVKSFVEGFEAYEQQIVTDGESVNGWLGYDLDKAQTYGWSQDSGAEWPYSGEPFAFAVWTPASVFGSEKPALANGANSVLFISSPDAQNNDWLISPQLSGKAQTISFKVSCLTTNYGYEAYEVYYSTTGKDVESFVKLADGQVTVADFTEVSYELPAGATYFAIRYVSNDIFGFIVDDIAYEGVTASIPTGYNVYINETLVASVAAEVTSYNYVGELNAGTTYKVSVSALYGNDESLPVNAEVAVSGIEEIAADAKAANIYNLSGIRVRADKELKSGVYVINGQKANVK